MRCLVSLLVGALTLAVLTHKGVFWRTPVCAWMKLVTQFRPNSGQLVYPMASAMPKAGPADVLGQCRQAHRPISPPRPCSGLCLRKLGTVQLVVAERTHHSFQDAEDDLPSCLGSPSQSPFAADAADLDGSASCAPISIGWGSRSVIWERRAPSPSGPITSAATRVSASGNVVTSGTSTATSKCFAVPPARSPIEIKMCFTSGSASIRCFTSRGGRHRRQ